MAVAELTFLTEVCTPLHEIETFSTGEMAALLGVTVDDVDYWVRACLVTPSIRTASGHGSRRLFGRHDLMRALLIQRLRNAEWKPKQIAKALTTIDGALHNPALLHTPLLIHEGSALLILCRSKGKEPMLLDAASPGQYVMVIALDTLEEETLQSLARSK